MSETRMEGSRVKLTEVNPHLVCVLCQGYFVDATTIAECLHSFCKSCIFRHLERESYCPICKVQVHNTKLYLSLKPDKTLQDIVYKLVPGLFHNEMQRRRDFYKTRPHRDEHLESECRGVGLDRLIYSPEDMISLSLEFYDKEREREEWSNTVCSPKPTTQDNSSGTKRYLQCPAGFKMAHLKKFLRQKYNLAPTCNVEIMYRRESLPDSYSLMDVAYIYTWKRNGPMRFYYRLPEVIEKKIIRLQPKTPSIKLNADNPPKDNVDVKDDVATKQDAKPAEIAATVKQPALKPPVADDITEQKAKENSMNASNISQEPAKPAEAQPKLESGGSAGRPLSKQDEISVSALLSLREMRPPGQPDHKIFAVPKPVGPERNGMRTQVARRGGINPRTNSKMSVNRIASELAENKTVLLQQRGEAEPKPETQARPEPRVPPVPPPPPQPPTDPPAQIKKPVTTPTNSVVENRQESSPKPASQALPAVKAPQSDPEPPSKAIETVSASVAHQNSMSRPQPNKLNDPKPEEKQPIPPVAGALVENKPPITMKLSSTQVISSSFSKIPPQMQNGAVKSTQHHGVVTLKNAQKEERNGIEYTKRVTVSKENDKPEIVLNTSDGSLTIQTERTDDSAVTPASPKVGGSPSSSPAGCKSSNHKTSTAQRSGHSVTITVEPAPRITSPQKETNGVTIHQSNINNRMPTFQKTGVGRDRKVGMNNGKINGPTMDQRIQQLYKNQGNMKHGNGGMSPGHQVRQQLPPAGQVKQESRLANWLNNRFRPVAQQPKPVPVAEKVQKSIKYPSPKPEPAPKANSPSVDKKPEPAAPPRKSPDSAKTPPPAAARKPLEQPKPDPESKQGSKVDGILQRQLSAAKLSKEMTMMKRKLEEMRKSSATPELPICEITRAKENPSPDEAKRRRDVTPDVSIELMRGVDLKKEFTIHGKDQMCGSSVKVKDKKRPVPGLKSIQEVEIGTKRKGAEGEQGNANKRIKLTTVRKEVPTATSPGAQAENKAEAAGTGTGISQTAALDLSKPAGVPAGPTVLPKVAPGLVDYRFGLRAQPPIVSPHWYLTNRPMLHPQFLPTPGK